MVGHRLVYRRGDEVPGGDEGMRLAACSCGASDGRWFRSGRKAVVAGEKFMRRHLRAVEKNF